PTSGCRARRRSPGTPADRGAVAAPCRRRRPSTPAAGSRRAPPTPGCPPRCRPCGRWSAARTWRRRGPRRWGSSTRAWPPPYKPPGLTAPLVPPAPRSTLAVMADTAVDVHLPAGHLTSAQVQLLAELAHTHGGGELHLTAHAQLQVRGDHAAISAALTAAGLTVDVPTRARLLVSPFSGRIGGHHDLRELTAAVLARLDERPVPA